ncbi:unnamed protein product [Ascophyllum nodosum]
MKLNPLLRFTLVVSLFTARQIGSAFVVSGSLSGKRTTRGCKHDPTHDLIGWTKRARGDSAKEAPKTVTMQGRQDGRRNNKCVFPADVKGALAALGTAAMGLALVGPMVSLPEVAAAADKRTIGEISASGLFFKDKLNVEAFSDPKVKGVTLYLSDFSRPMADKLVKGDFFSDPSSASLFCVRSGPMEVSAGIETSKEGEELFKEDRSFFKSIVVRRLYDKEANNVVYVSFSSKLNANSDNNKSRFKSSLCALHVE